MAGTSPAMTSLEFAALRQFPYTPLFSVIPPQRNGIRRRAGPGDTRTFAYAARNAPAGIPISATPFARRDFADGRRRAAPANALVVLPGQRRKASIPSHSPCPMRPEQRSIRPRRPSPDRMDLHRARQRNRCACLLLDDDPGSAADAPALTLMRGEIAPAVSQRRLRRRVLHCRRVPEKFK
jgi:hypothetical protein